MFEEKVGDESGDLNPCFGGHIDEDKHLIAYLTGFFEVENFYDRPRRHVADLGIDGAEGRELVREGVHRTRCVVAGRLVAREVVPDRTVTEIRPIGAADGSEGYTIASERSGLLPGRGKRTIRARGVVVAAGALGTNKLLQRCRLGGALPRVSSRLGELVRTNSESILAVTVPEDYPDDLTRRVAISGSIYPDADTHIETVSYGKDGDSMSLLYTLLVGDGTRVTRPLKLLAQIARHPIRFLKVLRPKGWSQRTIILLVMQTLDNAIALRPKQKRSGNVWLQTEQDPEKPNPTFIPVANDAAEWLAKRTGGVAQSSFTEALMNIPTTAHILGGAVIGHGPEDGVVDARQRVFGYENLLVCDGSAVPANVGVNPSLTITALAEHAISEVPPASEQQSYEANLSAT